jgi:sigma-B regulation protein RsbU (phosphoserine phosphatase)
MKALNDALVMRRIAGRYVTLLLVLWQPNTRTFTMANGGGSPPMVCRNGEVLKIQVEGVPLGLLPNREYDEREFHAQPGDVVVLFSDGVSDHLSADGQEYGRGGLALVVKRYADTAPRKIIDEVFADLDRFNTDRFDDQTLMVMRVQ